MDRAPLQMTAYDLIRYGIATLGNAPFRSFWLVGLLIAVASPSLVAEADELSLAATILFALVTFLIEMATVVAAADPAPDRSGDLWIRAALRRRSFWRFVVAALITDLAVAAGVLVLVVGGFVMAGIVGLAPQAAALERSLPLQSLARSAELSRPARGRIGIVYSLLVIVPALPSVALYVGGIELSAVGQALLGGLNTTFTLAAWIALTRAYVDLGGGTTPSEPPVERPDRMSVR